jgi:hypothetical protein
MSALAVILFVAATVVITAGQLADERHRRRDAELSHRRLMTELRRHR